MATDPNPDWVAIRAAYETTREPVAVICRRFGVRRDTLYRHKRSENWRGRKDAPPERGEVTARKGNLDARRSALIARLFHALEERIVAMDEDDLSHEPAGNERDARAIAALARTLETLTTMVEADDKNDTKQGEVTDDSTARADEFRALLKSRLDRLNKRRERD